MSETASVQAWATALTAPARGAVAVIRIWGPEAVRLADAVFRPHAGPRLSRTPPGRPRVGRIGLEESVALLDGDPPQVEIQCHGGPAAVSLVLQLLGEAGGVVAEPHDWLARESGTTIRAAALADLTRAPTVRMAEVLLEQARGALDDELRRIIHLASSDPVAALAELETLRARADFGSRLIVGWRIALAGRPNVGKSRLLNALAGFERAIVSPVSGTTRDSITLRTAFDGLPVELIDTAGLRQAEDPIEAAGLAIARARHAEADLVLLVLDRSEPLIEADLRLLDRLPNTLRVASKCDLPAAWKAEDWDAIAVSAERGENLDGLNAAIVGRLIRTPPPPGAAVPFRSEHRWILDAAVKALRSGQAQQTASLLRALIHPPARSL